MSTLHDFSERHPIWAFLILAYTITWTAWGLLLASFDRTPIEQLFSDPVAILIVYVGALGPTIAALVLTLSKTGVAGLKAFLRRSFRIGPGVIPASVVAALVPIGSALLAALIAGLTSSQPVHIDLSGALQISLLGAAVVFFAGPLCEEIGWRGYLQPHLLAVTNPIVAAILIGTAWCFWHVPLSFTPGTTPNLDSFVAWLTYYADTIAASAVMLGLVVWARGNVGVAMIYHWSSNVASSHIVAPLFPDASEAVWSLAHNFNLVFTSVAAAVVLMLIYHFRRTDARQ